MYRLPNSRLSAFNGLAVAGLALVLTTCVTPAPVPLRGSPVDLAPLVGEWRGEYESSATGRSGTISFDLAAANDQAHGEVVMIPRGGHRPYRPARYDDHPGLADLYPHAAQFEVLHIDVVRVEGYQLRGQLAPYRDPDCDCLVSTVFEGTLDGDYIRGSYTTRFLDTGDEATGHWSVARN